MCVENESWFLFVEKKILKGFTVEKASSLCN